MPARKVELPEQIKDKKRHHFRYVDYEYCQRISQSVGIKSARQYRLWIRLLEPAGFTKRPDLIYGSEWQGWDKFLDTDNRPKAEWKCAVRREDLLPYWDAVVKVQFLQLKTMKEWYEAYDAGRVATGIPRQPHLRYPVFYVNGAWKVWLGKGVNHRVVAAQNRQKLFVLYRIGGRSSNVISVMIHVEGIGDLRSKVLDGGLEVLKVYLWNDIDGEQVFPILDYYGKSQGDEVSWLFSNVNDLYWELDNVLDKFVYT